MKKSYFFIFFMLCIYCAPCSTKSISKRAQRKQNRIKKTLHNNKHSKLIGSLYNSMDVVDTTDIVDTTSESISAEHDSTNVNTSLFESKQSITPTEKRTVVETKNSVLSPFQALQSIDMQESFHNNQSDQNDTISSKSIETDLIEFHFENADLSNFLKQIEDIFDVTFITDDIIEPATKNNQFIKGNKISFKTHKALSRKEAWNLFVSIMQIARFAVIPHQQERVYHITSIDKARRSALPSFIGVSFEDIPETDDLIRYVYFVENTNLEALQPIIESLKSPASDFVILKTHKAFMLTDKAYNIKMLMKIIKELDGVSTPESMSILKLRSADAKEVADLYQSLLPNENTQNTGRLFAKKQPTSLYFPENTRIIAEPRTNALILLGAKDAIEKIEAFVKKHIDVEIDQAYSPLYIYQLKYADAETVASIMNDLTKFGETTDAGKAGGVRGVDQYIRPMSFVAETETNRIIIKGYHDDYLKAKKIIEQLDEQQPQVAIEILILSITGEDEKSLGGQIRSKEPGPNGLLGNNIKFQTSGLFGTSRIVENKDEFDNQKSGVERILGNLLNVVTNAKPGNTIISLGKDAFGVWGIFQMLKQVTNAEIVSNPFLLATNKTPSKVYLGEERRVRTAIISGSEDTTSFGNDRAVLEVNVTPQINSDGMIILELVIKIDNFVNQDQNDGTKLTKKITTSTILSDKEVLALGGFVQNRTVASMSKTPILGNIPLLGWFFKNKFKKLTKENLLILISPRIIASNTDKDALEYTQKHIDDYYGTIDEMHEIASNKDPIHKIFFENESKSDRMVESFIFDRKKPTRKERFAKRAKTRARRERNKRRKKEHVNCATEEIVITCENSTNTTASKHIQEKNMTTTTKTTTLHPTIRQKKSNQLLMSDIFASARKGQNT